MTRLGDRTDFFLLAIVLAVVSSVAVLSFEVLQHGISSPLKPGSDIVSLYVQVQEQLSEGFGQRRLSNLGWPFGQDTTLFPGQDLLSKMLLIVLGTLINDGVSLVNAYMLLSFPIIGGLSFFAARFVGLGRVYSLLFSITLALLPWRFERLEHPFLSAYFSVPLGIVWLYSIWIVSGFRAQNRSNFFLGLCAGLLLGLGQPYYLAFFLPLGLAVLLARAVRLGPSREVLWSAIVFISSIPGFLIFQALNHFGRTSVVLEEFWQRQLTDQWYYGGTLVSFLSPQGFFSSDAQVLEPLRIAWSNPFEGWEGNAFPSLAATIFFLGALLALLFIPATEGKLGGTRSSDDRMWMMLFILSLLLFATGGFGLVVGSLFEEQVRAYGRLAPTIVALSAIVASIPLRFASSRMKSLGLKNYQVGGLSLVLAGALVADQALWDPHLPFDRSIVSEADSYEAKLLEHFPAECPVYNFPDHDFPEGGGRGSTSSSYDHFVPALSNSGRPLSFGAMKGELGQEWDADLGTSAQDASNAAATLGFCILQIDTFMSNDYQSFEQYLGPPKANLRDRWFAFSLERAAYDVELVENLLSRPEVALGSGWANPRRDDSGVFSENIPGKTGEIRVGNPSKRRLEVVLKGRISVEDCLSLEDLDFALENQEVGRDQPTEMTDVLSDGTFAVSIGLDPMEVRVLQIKAPIVCVQRGYESNRSTFRVSDLSVELRDE